MKHVIYMRVVLYILAVWLYASEVFAQDVQATVKRGRGVSEKPIVPTGLQVSRFASGLGDISAVVGRPDGTIFVSDKARGRVYELVDRNKDGTPDLSRVMADEFLSPSGLAIIEPYIYVSDARAIWKVPLSGGDKVKFVSLQNSQSKTFPRPMLGLPSSSSNATEHLLIGLTKNQDGGEIIAIDIATKQAKQLSQGPYQVTSLARSGRSLWVGTNNSIIPMKDNTLSASEALRLNAPVAGLVLPAQYEWPDALNAWQSDILVSLGPGPSKRALVYGSQVKSIPTQFGNIAGVPKPFVSGFVSTGGRTGWGKPGPMWMDRRGLFVGDSWSGVVWLIAGEIPDDNPQVSDVETPQVDTKEEPTESSSEALPLIDGIEQTPAATLKVGSQIDKASRLEYGSSIAHEWEEERKAKEKLEAKDKLREAK